MTMVAPIILLSIAILLFLLTLLPSQKEKRETRGLFILFATLLMGISCLFAVIFALDAFTKSPSSHVVTATISLYVAISSLFLFIALPKDNKILPSVLVGLTLIAGIIFLGFAFYYGRVSLDNETVTPTEIRVLFTSFMRA